jgi:nicotinate-nucleotide pyrophosphorylase (carboxylating)
MENKKTGYLGPVNKITRNDYYKLLKLALAEDKVNNDVTSKSIFNKKHQAKAILLCKSGAVLCGIDLFTDVFKIVDKSLNINIKFKDGNSLKKGDIVAEISGRTISILKSERVALNFLSMLSGIATTSRLITNILKPHQIAALDTRKTIPGFRILSKYAVYTGGAANHRLNLSDMGLIKDNHIAAAKGIKNSIRMFRKKFPALKCEVEVENELQLQEALGENPDMILLDNMTPLMLKRCTRIIKNYNKKNSTHITCEASGGFSIENIHRILKTGIDYISMGSLTNNIKPVDFSLEVITEV